MKRLPPQPGEWIDRTKPVTFSFEGRRLAGFEGDSISSALAANGIRVVGRSFKYHRPRGLLSVANHEVNAMFQVEHRGRSRPNVRGDVTPLADGMQVRAVNTFGGLARDRARWLDWLAPLLPVGFYYKAFHEFNGRFMPQWERMFRRLTGLGVLPLDAAAEKTPKRYDFCDVLVIGGGPSGVAAALAAADGGAEVVIVDEHPRFGGSAVAAGSASSDHARLQPLLDRLSSHPHIRALGSTFAAGYYADHWVALVGPEFLTKMRARAVVIAQGAFEQPAVFRNNDLPGVMLAGGARRLLHRYAVAPCSRVAILAANAQGYQAAFDALAHGIEVAAVIELRHQLPPPSADLARPLASRGVPIAQGAAVRAARADFDGLLAGVEYGTLRSDGAVDLTSLRTLECDGLWMSVGFAPASALLHQAGARMTFDDGLQQFVPAALPAGVFVCGRVNGVYGLEQELLDGELAGRAAAAFLADGAAPLERLRPATEECPSHPWPIVSHPKGKNFVDFDEDLQLKDFANAAQEGFDNIELLKRYSTVGMGPSQGKHSNMNAIRILARLRREPVERVGSTTARPLFHPVPMSLLAGRGFSVERETPLASEHERLGAVWMLAAPWRRPEYYRAEGAGREEAVRAEVRAVRERAGLIDVGTLGKIEIRGPDAAEFLERVYTGRFANLKVGMTRYGLMCDEAGVVIDDGVIARLSPQHFYFTTTTGGSAAVYRELTRWATIWGADVGLVNLTGHLAAFNLAGPLSRAVLRSLCAIDLSDAAFPYLGARLAEVAGVPARLLRVGFVGEVGYEVHVPASTALRVWRALMAAGRAHGIRPFGVEAQRRLRLEKGHIIVGQDSDGLSTPFDLNCGWAVRMDKPFFVGQRSLAIIAGKARKQTLVGFELADPGAAAPKEGHLVIEAGAIAGRVTSCAYSPTLAKTIGLAFVRPEIEARGTFSIRVDGGQMVAARVVALPFYDAGNERQKLDPVAREAA
jgi:sarcosine oxidase subunit alpha